jgi:hypothetical protein
MDGTFDPNNSQLFFRPLQAPLNTTDGTFFSLGAAQQIDPTIRINKYDSNGTFINFGYPYDTQFNPLPPGSLLVVAGGAGPNPLVFSQDGQFWSISPDTASLITTCYAIAYNGVIWLAGGVGTNTVLSSSNGRTWSPNTQASDILIQCNAIASNEVLWVIGGYGRNTFSPIPVMAYSYDGINWTANIGSISTSIFNNGYCSSIAQNGSLWLAGAAVYDTNPPPPYRVAYSLDGISWTGSSTASAYLDNCFAIGWSGSLWVVGGDASSVGVILYSNDGRTWTKSTSGNVISDSVRAISWNGVMWTAGGYDSTNAGRTLAYSYDGVNWTSSPSVTIFTTVCSGLTWIGTSWQATGLGGIATSTDGVNWATNTSGSPILENGFTVAVNRILPFVQPGPVTKAIEIAPLSLLGSGTPGSSIFYSFDGITWNATNFTVGGTVATFSWNGFIWVAGIQNSVSSRNVIFSYDGIVWNISSSGSSFFGGGTGSMNSVAWGDFDGIFIGVGRDGVNSSGNMIESTNGINWTQNSSGSALLATLNPSVIAYNGDIWLVGSTIQDLSSVNNIIIYSTDGGATWNNSASAAAIFLGNGCKTLAWNGLLWAGAQGAFLGQTVVGYSYDGITWYGGTIGADLCTGGINTIIWNGSLFVIGGVDVNGNTLGYSYDGITWYPSINTLDLPTINSVTWNGTLWIAAAGVQGQTFTNNIAYSYNGVTWYPSPNGSSLAPYATATAVNRVDPYAGYLLPPLTLDSGATVANGYVTYTSTGSTLYASHMLYLDESGGTVGINQTTGTYFDLSNVPIKAALEISGGAITVNTYANNSIPGLYLTANNVNAGSGGRIELYDGINDNGWRLDNNVDYFNHFQILSFPGNNPRKLQVDINPNLQEIGIGGVSSNTQTLTVYGPQSITSNLNVGGITTVDSVIRPSITGTINLGTSTLKWNQIFATGTISTLGQISATSASAGVKSFVIDHPNPALTKTHKLSHCCVEGPTRGETLNRWSLTTTNKICIQALPSYSPYLNENWQFFVNGIGHFGTGYVTLNQEETEFTLTTSQDGSYSVLGIATRKDKAALTFDEKGIEYLKEVDE